MTSFFKPAVAAGLAMLVTMAPAFTAPAAAQASGNIATVDIALAVARADARQPAYQQISATYQTQQTTIQQRMQERQTLVQSFDTNSNGVLDESEAAATQNPNNATVQRIQAIDNEVGQLQAPIQRARVYVITQIGQQFAPALQQVVADKNIQFVVAPDALVYAAEAADVTDDVVASINTRAPTVTAFPPEGWQPSEQAVALFQQVQQILTIALEQQRQQQAAQQPAGEVPSR